MAALAFFTSMPFLLGAAQAPAAQSSAPAPVNSLAGGIIFATVLLVLLGFGCLVGFVASRGRYSFVYLGFTFFAFAIAEIMNPPLFFMPLGVGLLCFIKALTEGAQETKARMEKMREEQQAREEAFAELQIALARKETAEGAPQKSVDVGR